MLKRFILVISLAAWFATSCATSHAPRDLKGSVSTIQDYANSFLGLDIPAARARLSGVQVKQNEWRHGGYSGPQLVATYPDYELRVLFYEGEAITTSFQVLTK